MPKKQKMVLIVEDDEIILRALYLSLHEKGYTLATATDGESGYLMAERLHPDLILLDLILPKKDGFECLKNIRASAETKGVPVVVLSNLGDDESIEKAKKLGADDYFVKAETDLSDLVEKVATILAKK